MSKITNGGLDQYRAEPFEQQQFGTAGVEGVNSEWVFNCRFCRCSINYCFAVSSVINLSHWRRHLWDTGTRAPSTSNNSTFQFSAHFGTAQSA